jgi:hypothetical protein
MALGTCCGGYELAIARAYRPRDGYGRTGVLLCDCCFRCRASSGWWIVRIFGVTQARRPAIWDSKRLSPKDAIALWTYLVRLGGHRGVLLEVAAPLAIEQRACGRVARKHHDAFNVDALRVSRDQPVANEGA